MSKRGPRYSMDEFARRGEEIFERDVQSQLDGYPPDDFVLIDIESGAYEVDADALTASDRLLARYPDAQTWMRRVGSRQAYRFGLLHRATARRSPALSQPRAKR
jgi:hypothetical protein